MWIWTTWMMMMHPFMEEEAITTADEEENFIILTTLEQLQAGKKATPKREDSKCGRKKLKLSKRMDGHAILYTDYSKEFSLMI
jgi:hypothetical protein